ncbi:MAG: carbon-nitrogen hydrolase family protein, partial [Vulcanimicrobiaceae bacterium]
MTRTIRTAALQLRATARRAFVDAWPQHLGAIEDAARHSDLLVLPEASIPAYVLGDDATDDAAIERAVAEVRGIARRHGTVIVAGVAQRDGMRLHNRALVIERNGAIAGHADKLFLWHFDRKWFEAGSAIEPVSTSLGKLGVLVCADGRIPGIARALVDRGAELLVMPTAWVTSGRDPEHLENAQADLLVRVRAFENGVPFIAANKCGVELAMVAYCGKSQIVAANGELLAIAGERD